MRTITIYEVFELNRVLHKLLEQQISYQIQTAFKIHNLIKWLDETEKFIIERMHLIFGDDFQCNEANEVYQVFLSSPLPFIETDLTTQDLVKTDNNVTIDVKDAEILTKFLDKTED